MLQSRHLGLWSAALGRWPASGSLARREAPQTTLAWARAGLGLARCPHNSGQRMSWWDHYHLPESVEATLTSLERYGGAARLVAGGTDLLLELQQGRKPRVTALVDVSHVPEMTGLERDGDQVLIGAAVSHSQIVAWPPLLEAATCLVESCSVIGGPQVRNVATLGGNVAHALPAGDGSLSLVALEAEAEVAGPGGRDWRPVLSLFAGPGRSALDPGREVIVRFRLHGSRLAAGEASAYGRIMRPQGVALPILGLAAWVALAPDGRLQQVRLALGPAGPVPLRPRQAELALAGCPWDAAALDATTDAVLAEAQLRDSPHRSTRAYRRELVGTLVQRALGRAVERAQARRLGALGGE
jgi:carbon-monoxide dehydrogenase medium subunit